MKQFYFSILFLSLSLFITAQTNPTGGSAETGITDGNLSVTLSGGASYSVPIAVPPGINGVVPQISLTYNSQSGIGTAGYGWDMSGISTISRIPATKFHDGTIDGVDFNALDRFALDGQRLVLKTGTGKTYGADQATYETENFSNVKITSYGVHPNGTNYGPAYFLVEYPDGSKAYYGNSTDSRSITEWSITYFENAQGARITYNYNLSNNLLEIASIKYGTLTIATPINTIQFVYEAMTRENSYYIGGQNIKRVKRLKEINVSGNGVSYRNYELKYIETVLKFALLDNLTEKSGDKTKSYNPTVFKYAGTNNSISYVPFPNTLSVDNVNSLNASTVSGDFDGDGNMDFLLYPTTGSTAKSKFWLFTGINPNVGAQTYPKYGIEYKNGSFQEIFPVSFLTWNNKLSNIQGWTLVQGNTFTTLAFTSTYQVVQQDQKTYDFPRFVLDYYYDCQGVNSQKTDVSVQSVPIDPPPGEPTPAHYETDISRTFISGDFNGDGLTDIVAIEKSFLYPYTIGCSTINQTYKGGKCIFINLDKRLTSNFANGAGSLITTNNSKFLVADFNGDGKSDIYVFDTGSVKIYSLNDSKQFTLLFQISDASIVLNKPIVIGDYNGDGKSDFMIPLETNTGWYRYISTGISFVRESKTALPYSVNDSYNSYNYTATDYDNDGKSDFNIIKNNRNGSTGTIQITSYTERVSGDFYSATAITTAQSNIDIYALPIYLPSTDRKQSRFEIAFINNNKLHFFNSQKNTNQDRLLTSITTGNGVQEFITYQSLDQIYKINLNPVYNTSIGTENYPYYDIVASPDFQIVTKLEKKSDTVSRIKLYGYYGAITNYEGLGFMGFRSIMESSWHNTTNPPSCTITSRDFKRRGAITESYFLGYLTYPYNGFSTTNYATKSVLSYTPANPDTALLANKVFKQQNTAVIEYNGLNNTSSETTNVFDSYNNITNSTTITKEGASEVQKTSTDIVYQSSITSPLYILGRPDSKTQTITIQPNNNTMLNKEVYTYNAQQLLSNIERSSTGAPTINENNTLFDSYGNIKTKTISSTTLSRVTKYEYDNSGRFLTKITDPNLLSTSFEYYTDSGLLKKRTDPYGQSVSYTYDSWLKKLTETDDKVNATASTVYTKSGKETTVTTTAKSNIDLALDTSITEEKFDDLGRKTRSGVKDLNGSFSYVSYLYDIYDRAYKVSEPYFGTSPSQWNETKFDIYSRPIQSILFNQRTVSISYPGLKTTITDGQRTKDLIKNAVGNIISSTENSGGTIGYTYFANGNLNKASYNGIDIITEQNGWGYKTKLTDPSAGTYIYDINDFGELKSETIQNAGITTTITRDPANGKITKKTITGSGTNSETTYIYDGDLPLTITYVDNNEASGTNKITTTYTYDNTYKRVTSIVEYKSGVSKFTRSFTYDALGRIATETKLAEIEIGSKSSSVTTKNVYKNGDLYQIQDTNNKVLWQTNTLNAKGQVVESVTGNGTKMTNNYDSDGYLSKIVHDKTTTPTSNIITLTTAFNKNTDYLDSRINSAFGNYAETFKYDDLGRLKTFTNRLGVDETQTYDTSGKITGNNLGTYAYDPVKKYQNTSVTLTPEATGYYASREGIFNDSMENLSGWQIYGSGIFSYDKTVPAHSGNTSLKISNTEVHEKVTNSSYWINIDNVEPTQYTYSAWVKSDGPQAELFLFMKTETEQAGWTIVNSKVTNVINQWTEITGTYMVPANIKKLNIRLDNNGTGNIWFDDVKIRKTSDAPTADRKLIITYNAFKSPILINETGVDKINFIYNDNNQRSMMFYGGQQVEKMDRPLRKYYSADGSMEVKQNTTTGNIEFVTYIGGDGYSAPIAVKSDGINAPNYLYLHRDYQGSILAITDANGALVEKRLFDAWGSIIRVQNGAGNILAGLTVLDRGYTGHEHLQSVGLINMNARLYDPMLHRFLQVDNFIQDPTNTQNYNQYGYVFNNPLIYSDPSGNAASGPGRDCVDCGLSNGDQTFIGATIGTVVTNWDNWNIKDWANRNINGDKFSEWWKSKVSLKNLFGGGNENSTPAAPPNRSSYVNISSKNITPFEVGVEWLSGQGIRDRKFTNGDNFTEMLRQHSHVQDTREMIVANVNNGGKLEGSNPYRLGGIRGVGLYLKDYSTLLTGGLTGNLAVTYLGSYNLQWVAIPNYKNNTVLIQFSVKNTSTMQSASRPPILGYLPLWQDTVGKTINEYF